MSSRLDDVIRRELQRQIVLTYRPALWWRLWYAVTLGRWRHRKHRAQLASLDAATAQARAAEAACRDALPGRMAEVAAEITAALPPELRDAGMQFEWAAEDEAGCE